MAKKAKTLDQMPLAVDDTQVEPGADVLNDGAAAPGETNAGPRTKRYRVLVAGATAICGGGGQVYPVQVAQDGSLQVELPAGETWYAAMVESGQLVRV